MERRDRGRKARTDALRRSPATTFAAVFSAALSEHGRTLTWLRSRLEREGVRVALSTLSYWRSGQRQPEGPASREAVSAIEEVLDLDGGVLTDTLYPARRSGPVPGHRPAGEVFRTASDIEAVLDELALSDWTSYLAERSIHAVVDVDEHGNDRTVTIRTLLVALRDGARRFPIALAGPPPLADPPRFVPIAGCTRGREIVRLGEGVVATEMLLDRPLRVGESVVVEHLTHLPAEPHTYYEQYVQRSTREIMVWVRFHESRLPGAARVYAESEDSPRRERAVDLDGSTTVHHSTSNFGPGVIGVSWEWPTAPT